MCIVKTPELVYEKECFPSLFNYEFFRNTLKKIRLETCFGKHRPKLQYELLMFYQSEIIYSVLLMYNNRIYYIVEVHALISATNGFLNIGYNQYLMKFTITVVEKECDSSLDLRFHYRR